LRDVSERGLLSEGYAVMCCFSSVSFDGSKSEIT
jgi:hypothetical protein